MNSFFDDDAGGFGGGRSRGMFDDDDDDISAFTGMGGRGMPGGMPGGRRPTPRTPQQQPSQPSEISKPLPISLEDLYSGTTKRMKVSRKLLSGGTEEKVFKFHLSTIFIAHWNRYWRYKSCLVGNPVQRYGFLVRATSNQRESRKTSSSS